MTTVNPNSAIAPTQGASVVQFAYDGANRRTTLTLPNGVSTQYGFDGASHLTTLTYKLGATTLGDLQYLYDAGGNRIQVGGSWARTGLPLAVASATYNVSNQQLAFGGETLTYDLNGNLTSDGMNTYTWDARNRLTAITGPVPASFLYDAASRRAQKTIGGVTTAFLYDALNPVQEQSGSTITNLLTGLGIDEHFSRLDATNMTFFLTDALASTIGLADGSGSILTSYTYEPFGATSMTGGAASNPYDFTGRDADLTGLKYFRARYYHPILQRFISEDPILQPGSPFETVVVPSLLLAPLLNTYAYVSNDPLNKLDPLGLLEQCLWGGFSGAGAVGIGGQLVFQKGFCRGDCGKWLPKTRNCFCFSFGLGLTGGLGGELGDTSSTSSGWSIGAAIAISGSGLKPTGFTVGPGMGAFYSWCACDVF